MTNNYNSKIGVFPSYLNKDSVKKLNSESGSFLVNEHGIVQCFEPADDNPFIDEETEIKANYIYTTHKSICTYVEHLAFY